MTAFFDTEKALLMKHAAEECTNKRRQTNNKSTNKFVHKETERVVAKTAPIQGQQGALTQVLFDAKLAANRGATTALI